MRQRHAFFFLTQPCLARQQPKHMVHSHLLFSLANGMHWPSLEVDYTNYTERDHYLLACSLSLCSVPQTRQPAISFLLCLLTYASRKAVGLHSPMVGSGLSRQILSPFHQNLSANQSLCKKIVVSISQNEFHVLSCELLILCYYQFSTNFYSPTQCLSAFPAGTVQYQTGANVHLVVFRATVHEGMVN